MDRSRSRRPMLSGSVTDREAVDLEFADLKPAYLCPTD